MHAYSIFTIKLEGKDEDIRSATEFAEEVLGEDYEAEHGLIDVDECYEVVWLWDIEEFAARMANKFPELSFTMQGVVDTSESAGELMDFVIKNQDGKLTTQSSCWYLEVYSDGHLEDFLSRCRTEITEEEKERFLKGELPLFVLDSGDGDIVTKVPLSEPEEITFDDDDFDEEDDDDDFDEDDFDDDEDDTDEDEPVEAAEETAVTDTAVVENVVEENQAEEIAVEEPAAEAEEVAEEAAEETVVEETPAEEPAVVEVEVEETSAEEAAVEAPAEVKPETKPEKIGFFRRLFGRRRSKREK